MEDFNFNLDELKLEASTIEQITGNILIPEDKDKEIVNQDENKDKNNEKETKADKEVKDNTPSSEKNEDSSTFSVFAKSLKEEGVISLEDEDIENVKSVEDLKELIAKQIEVSKYSNLSESQKRYLEAVEAGISQAEYEKIEKQLNQLESINDEVIEKNPQARFDLIAFDFMSKGIQKEKAIEFAKRSIKLGTDIDDAKEALASLIKSKADEYKKIVTDKKEENKTSLEELKKVIENKETILKDIKLTPKQKTDIYNLVSTKVDTDSEGQPINEFNKWRKDNGVEAEITLAALYQLTNKFKDLGKILEKSKSKASQELENRLRQNEIKEVSDSVTFGNGNLKYDINV